MFDVSSFDALIFDMDGTLIDSMGQHLLAWQQACAHFGYPFDVSYMNSLGGVPTDTTVELLNAKFGLSHDKDQVAAYKSARFTELASAPVTIDATVQLLENWYGKKPLGVGTGAEREHAIEQLSASGLLPKLGALVTASDVAHGKPAPDTYLQVAALLGVDPSRCVVFEDTHIGLQAATSAGMKAVLVVDGQLVPQF